MACITAIPRWPGTGYPASPRRVQVGPAPNYLLWEEVPTNLIIEVTSRKTRRGGQGK